MNSTANDRLRRGKLCLQSPSLIRVVFINAGTNVAVVSMRGPVVLPAAATEGRPLLVTSAQGRLRVGLRDKTVTRL